MLDPEDEAVDDMLDAEDERLCRTAGWRFSALMKGRSSMSSAGWMAIFGITESECASKSLRGRAFDLLALKNDGKRAWAICRERTEDIVMVVMVCRSSFGDGNDKLIQRCEFTNRKLLSIE